MLCLTTRAPDLKLLYCGTVRQTLSQAEGSSAIAAPLVSLHRPPLLFGSSNGHPVLYAPLDQARTPLHLHRAVHIAGAKALGFRSGQVRSGSQSPCLRQSSPGAAGAEAGHAQTPTSPVTQPQDFTSPSCMASPRPLSTLSSFHSDGLTEVKRGPYTKSRSSQEEGQGWKPGPQALACLTIFPPHIGLTVRAGWMNPSRGPGTMSQLMSGAINTFAFPTAPTCPSWLPFLLMSGSEASGQDAWVCAENTAWPPPPARPCLGASVHLRFPH